MANYQYPEELKYSETHTWVQAEKDSQIVVVGITDYVQAALGEVISVDLPNPTGMVDVGDEICSVEGTHTLTEVYAPLAGTLIAVNEDLIDAPGFINSDPYGDGWLYKLQLADKEEYNKLYSADEYVELIDEENNDDE